MRIPYNWLKEWVCPLAPPEELAERLTMAGLEVEAVEKVGEELVLVGKITPNRGDWLSIRGVAMEVAAIYGSPMVPHDTSPPQEGNRRTKELVQVAIEEDELCPRYSARIIEGVEVGESPPWVRNRLLCAGIRPVNNLVDATNYVLMELGQPLHAFDLDRLADATIIVRRGREGETLTTIDGRERSVSREDLVIADARGAVALAGVMGGLETEVGLGTRRILLESAHFAPFAVRRTAKAQGMQTEASYRFERWVDPAGTVEALNVVSRLIVEVAGGQVSEGTIDVCPRAIGPTKVLFRPQRVNALLGTRMKMEQMVGILRALGFSVEGEGQLTVSVPTSRNDISREEDLVEELARLLGYDRIPSAVPTGPGIVFRKSEELDVAEEARQVLMRCGLREVITFSLTRPAGEMQGIPNGELVRLSNPLVEEFSGLRASLLPSLLEVAVRNFERGARHVNVFEVGKAYEQLANGSCSERWLAGVLLSGASESGTPGDASADFYGTKGIVEVVLREFRAPQVVLERGREPFYATGRSAAAVSGGETLAHWGQVEEGLLKRFDLSQAVFYAEVDLERLAGARSGGEKAEGRGWMQYSPIPRYPAVRRDLAVEIPEQMTFAQLERLVRGKSDELLVEVSVFDVYRGQQVPDGKKSVAIRLDFRASDRTLNDQEVTSRIESIIAWLERQAGVVVRRAPGA